MKCKKCDNKYIIRLDRGEKIIDTIKKLCEDENINCGYFFGIGSLDRAELAHYIVNNKKYTSKLYRQPLEVVNLTGNIATMNDEVYLHCHAALSDVEMHVIAGHLKEGTISATGEIILVKMDANIERKYDDDVGLNLMDI